MIRVESLTPHSSQSARTSPSVRCSPAKRYGILRRSLCFISRALSGRPPRRRHRSRTRDKRREQRRTRPKHARPPGRYLRQLLDAVAARRRARAEEEHRRRHPRPLRLSRRARRAVARARGPGSSGVRVRAAADADAAPAGAGTGGAAPHGVPRVRQARAPDIAHAADVGAAPRRREHPRALPGHGRRPGDGRELPGGGAQGACSPRRLCEPPDAETRRVGSRSSCRCCPCRARTSTLARSRRSRCASSRPSAYVPSPLSLLIAVLTVFVQSNVRLRLRIGFSINGQAVQDQVDFAGFPPGLTGNAS